MHRLSVFLCLSILVVQEAHASDLSGSYAGQCTGAIQCAVEISDKAVVSVIVADQFNYADKKCLVSGRLQRAGNGLAGVIKNGWKVSVSATPDGGIYLNGLPKKACGLNLNGYYGAIGD